ncbi:acetyl-CoA carboxylase biotin carboxyl carrier protein [bacterium]|nr:acetyl-CoA carboxylase biotin carboxyl carrier protein [bacterium]
MDLKEIKRLIEMVEYAKISHFSIEYDDKRIEIKKEWSGNPVVQPHQVVLPPSPTVASPLPDAPSASTPLPIHDSNLIPITSQMVGTFYSAPSPDAAPFVKVGDRIAAGTVICMIEAMKLFNEIESEVSGVIEKVCVNNAESVEYGQELFLVRIG